MYGYFDIMAEIGLTNHMGGLKATKELLEFCKVDDSKYLLVVGSGDGCSAVQIARLTGCRIVGIDISLEMVEKAREISEDRVEFQMGDSENIPFPQNTFDVVLCESVVAFTDKKKSLLEYHRVLKKGGYVALNEVTWLDKPSKEITDYSFRVIGGLQAENKEGWISLIEEAGFKDVTGIVRPMNRIRQAKDEIEMQGIRFFKIWGRFFYLYLFDKEFRKSANQLAKDALKLPKEFMKYYGYGLYIGRK